MSLSITAWPRPRRAARIGVWGLRGALALLFITAGFMKLLATPFEVASFLHFGYPRWFMYAIGLAELAGGAALLSRSLVQPGALGMASVMVGAIVSHLRAGDPLDRALPPLIVLGLLLVLSAAHRRQPD